MTWTDRDTGVMKALAALNEFCADHDDKSPLRVNPTGQARLRELMGALALALLPIEPMYCTRAVQLFEVGRELTDHLKALETQYEQSHPQAVATLGSIREIISRNVDFY